MKNWLKDINENHIELLSEISDDILDESELDETIQTVKEFIQKIADTGRYIEDVKERLYIMSLQQYWINYVYEQTRELITISLQPFIRTNIEDRNEFQPLVSEYSGIIEKQIEDTNSSINNAQKSIAELRKQLQNAQPVTVDRTGILATPEETNFKDSNPVVRPARWF